MGRMVPLIRGAGLAALLFLAGCSDSTEENPGSPGNPAAGTYALLAPFIAFDGEVAVPESGGFHLKVIAVEGRLVLAADSTYEHRVRLESHIDGALAGTSNWVAAYRFRRRG